MESYSMKTEESRWKEFGDWLEQQVDEQAKCAEAESDKTFKLIHIGMMIGTEQCRHECNLYATDLVAELEKLKGLIRRDALLRRIGTFDKNENLIIGKWACLEVERIIQIAKFLQNKKSM